VSQGGAGLLVTFIHIPQHAKPQLVAVSVSGLISRLSSRSFLELCAGSQSSWRHVRVPWFRLTQAVILRRAEVELRREPGNASCLVEPP
jgi:hypothetical protein